MWKTNFAIWFLYNFVKLEIWMIFPHIQWRFFYNIPRDMIFFKFPFDFSQFSFKKNNCDVLYIFLIFFQFFVCRKILKTSFLLFIFSFCFAFMKNYEKFICKQKRKAVWYEKVSFCYPVIISSCGSVCISWSRHSGKSREKLIETMKIEIHWENRRKKHTHGC